MSDSVNTFTLPPEHYTRNYDLIQGYLTQSARYLAMQTGRPYEECLEFVKKRTSPENPKGIKDPTSLVLVKDQNGDRHPKRMGFLQFLNTAVKNNYKISPALICYVDESVRVSKHATFIAEDVAERSRLKKEMFIAKQDKRMDDYNFYQGGQAKKKTNNNAHSGATQSNATTLYYASTHPSLTSTCRVATSTANAANEKFIIGNRHYHTPDVVKANILATIEMVDLPRLEKVIADFGIHIPTPDECMECVEYSSKEYWQSPDQIAKLKVMFENMTGTERCAFVYCSDYYHFNKHNREIAHGLLKALSNYSTESDGPNVTTDLDRLDEDMRLLVTFLHHDVTEGKPMRQLKEEKPLVVGQMNRTARMLIETLDRYRELIHVLFLSDLLPGSIYAFPNARRRTVPISDTDSTMFTLAYWVEEIFGYAALHTDSKRIAFAMVFIITGIVAHLLALISIRMGVKQDKVHLLKMKNEFYFAVLFATTSAKHYFASQDAQEGNFYSEPELEVKGVGLRDSKLPREVNTRLKEMMSQLIETMKAGEKIELKGVLTEIADFEREIVASIKRGEGKFAVRIKIKPESSYADPAKSVYFQYPLWNEVFAPSYAPAPTPQYDGAAFPLMTSNKTALKQWCDSMSDRGLAKRLENYMLANRRNDMSRLIVPVQIIEQFGLPEDILKGIDYRAAIIRNMSPFYLLLESFGVMFRDKNNTKVVSDFY